MAGARQTVQPGGPDVLSVRSAFAPGPWSVLAPLGAGLVAAASAAGALAGSGVGLVAALVAVLIVVGLAGRRGDAVVVGVLAVVGAAAAGAAAQWSTVDWALGVGLVAAVATTAAMAVHQRVRGRVSVRQLGLLRDLVSLSDEDRGVAQTVDRVLDLLVPAFGDVCAIDLRSGDELRRLGAHVADRDPEIERVLRARIVTGQRGTSAARPGGRAQLVDPVEEDHLRRVAAGQDELRAFLRLRLRSLMYVPLVTRGRVFGVLSLGVGTSRRRYHDEDLRFAEVVAGRVAIVLDNAGLTRRAASAEAHLVAALEGLDEAVTINAPDGRTVYVNEAAVRLLQVSGPEVVYAANVGEISARFAIYDEHGTPLGFDAMPAFKALRGDPDPDPLLVRNVVRDTGEERWLLNRVTILRDPDGAIDSVVNVIEDVTQVKRAELSQRLLAEAARALSSSLDYEQTLQRVAEVAVPDLADWCSLDLPGRDGTIEPVAIAHADPAKLRLGRELRERYPVRMDDGTTVAGVIAGGPSVLIPQSPDEALAAFAVDETHLRLLRSVGFGSILIVPVQGGGEHLGAMTLVRSDPIRQFTPDDQRLAEELGRRAGAAVLNARLYSERATIARDLQDGLRPPRLPAIAGVRAATLYRPAGELNDVGGDFYDAVPTPGGWMVVMGDVAGQGARAAALTGLARHTLRAAGRLTGDLAATATQLNAALREQPELSLVTAALVLLQAGGERLQLSIVSCGHPLPVLLRDGVPATQGVPGPLAGAFDDATWTPTTTSLQDGDALLLYTDGVLDTVGAAGRFGDDRLMALLPGAPADPAALVTRIDEALAGFQQGLQRDDTAIVALTITDAAAALAAMPALASGRDDG